MKMNEIPYDDIRNTLTYCVFLVKFLYAQQNLLDDLISRPPFDLKFRTVAPKFGVQLQIFIFPPSSCCFLDVVNVLLLWTQHLLLI